MFASRRAQAILRKIADQQSSNDITLICTLRSYHSLGRDKVDQFKMYKNFLIDLIEKDSIRVEDFNKRLSDLKESKVMKKCGKWLRVRVALDGMVPVIWRDLLVNPEISMQSLHNQVCDIPPAD